MKAVVCKGKGDAGVLEIAEVAAPKPSSTELLLAVGAAGVNRADILQRQGHYPPPPGESKLLGLEIAGRVIAIGETVDGFAPGDRVFGLVSGGGYAEQCVLDYRMATRTPDAWDDLTAAAIPEAFYTANENLFSIGGLQAGETVLIHAGGSGVGSIAIQMATKVGARVLTTAGSAAKLDRCKRLGAEIGINYKSDDFVEATLAATEGRGVDLILDFVGAAYLMRNLGSLARNGRLVIVGLLGGVTAQLDLRLLLSRCLSIKGTIMRSQTIEAKIAIKERFERRWCPLSVGDGITPVIHRTFPLSEAADAHRMMEASTHFGKILLIP